MENEVILDVLNLDKQVKSIAKQQGVSMGLLKMTINELFDKHDTPNNLRNKFARKTLRVSELAEIAEVLNCEIVLRKKS